MENHESYLVEKLEVLAKWKKTRKYALFFAIFIIAVSLYLVINSISTNKVEFVLVDAYYFISFSNYFGNLSSIFYFTYQSNLLFGFVLLSYVLTRSKKKFQLLFATTTMITVVLIVFWTVIAWHINFSSFENLLSTATVHFLNPILAIISLFWFRKDYQISTKGMLLASIYSFAYLIFCALLYVFTVKQWLSKTYTHNGDIIYFYTGVTIYPFLNFLHPFFYSGGSMFVLFLLNLIMIVLSFLMPYGIGRVFIKLFSIQSSTWKMSHFIAKNCKVFWKFCRQWLLFFKKAILEKIGKNNG